MLSRKKLFLILTLGLLSAVAPFSIDMYLPGFPSIARDLHSTVARVSLSLSSFFFGISFGQFLYGPLLDRYGRKKPLFIGLAAYLLTSIGCALAPDVNSLIILRLLQALGGCVGMVASRALVRDIFPVEENARIFSLLMLVVGVSPIIAPTVGGYVSTAFGWQYVFVILAILAAVILACSFFFLPEGRPADPGFSLKPPVIVRNYWQVMKEPQFFTYALTGSLAASGLYAYISGSPYVFMELYKVTERQYGWIFSLVAFGLIASSQVNSFLLRRYRSEQIIRVSLLFQCLSGLGLLVGTWAGILGLYSTIFLCFIFLCCQGFTFPNSSALSLAPFSRGAGSASALMGGLQMGIGSLATVAVSILNNHSALPMTGVMAGFALASYTVLMLGRRVIRYRSRLDQVQEEAIETAI